MVLSFADSDSSEFGVSFTVSVSSGFGGSFAGSESSGFDDWFLDCDCDLVTASVLNDPSDSWNG